MVSIPAYNIGYKDQSTLMKILSKLMFFNPSFMTQYVTTIGNTIYFPSQQWVHLHPTSAKLVLCHEIVHIQDSRRLTMPVFSFLYLFPQILTLIALPLFFWHWWIGLACLLFLGPIPALGRMYLELKAYTFSMYSIYRMNQLYNYNIKYDTSISFYAEQFSNSDYYFMWPFGGPSQHLTNAVNEFQQGKKPFYSSDYYDMVDAMIVSNVNW